MKLIHNATLITPGLSDAEAQSRRGWSVAHRDGQIVEVGPAARFEPRIAASEIRDVFDARGRLLIPGLINTHHHLFQSLTRCHPVAQNVPLFPWLLAQYPIWRKLDYEAVHLAALVSLGELLLNGGATTSDHFYMFPRDSDVRMEAVFDAAEQLGMRLHLCRGSMTLGQSAGGLPPDDCVERDADVLADCERVLDRFHDPSPLAMRRVDLAPCSPFNVTPELLRDTVALARSRDVLLHTHLAETRDEERYCLERFGKRPTQYLDDLGFLGPHTYLAHCVCLNADEIRLFAERGVGVSHCPTSNMRLASGAAPLREMLAAGVTVGLALDGSSSNDGGALLAEARQCLLVDRLRTGLAIQHDDAQAAGRPAKADDANATDDPLMSAATALRLATIGGAACLRRESLGRLEPGSAADFAIYRENDLALAGAVAQDPLAALILCAAPRAEHVFVAGREVVREGRLVGVDQDELAERFNRLVSVRFR